MKVGLDVGYSQVKVKSGKGEHGFVSLVGTPDKARFSFSENGAGIVLTEPANVLIGEGAIRQSRFVHRREDRHWITSDAYRLMALAAFTEISRGTYVELHVVSGLPIAFYRKDKDILQDVLMREHRATREGRRAQVFKVTDCRIIPQPFGCLLSEALDDRGDVVDKELATGNVGIIDIGGKTCNLLSVNRLAEIGKETASVNKGAWDMVRAVRDWLSDNCPELDLQDHQVINAIVAREIKYYGEPVDLNDVVDDILEPMAEEVVSEAGQLWNGGAALDTILVSGGGSLLLGPRIENHFRHARVVDNPVFANVTGYYRFAQHLG